MSFEQFLTTFWRALQRCFTRRTVPCPKPTSTTEQKPRVLGRLLPAKPSYLQRQARHKLLRLRRFHRTRSPHSHFTFAREILRNPATMGAICPSSHTLARVMAEQLHNHLATSGYVVELGAGTGNITAALLQQGLAPQRLIAIEQSPKLAHYLQKRFPRIQVITGDASQLGTLLGDQTQALQAIVSGLPLRSLPPPLVNTILAEVRQNLEPNGIFVQFTYDLRASALPTTLQMPCIASRFIWRNLPPARVDVLQSAHRST